NARRGSLRRRQISVLQMEGAGTSAAGRRGRLNCWDIAGYPKGRRELWRRQCPMFRCRENRQGLKLV
ncbi:MAG: hypothetical protein M1588_01185, partial [Planctomycetes bacterium]|nr:hypothetical protein [Planctomycetota bacterium]